jgi:hypothetical protein
MTDSGRPVDVAVGNPGNPVDNLCNNLWTTYIRVTTRCCARTLGSYQDRGKRVLGVLLAVSQRSPATPIG